MPLIDTFDSLVAALTDEQEPTEEDRD